MDTTAVGGLCQSKLKMCTPYDSAVALINTYSSLRLREMYTLVPGKTYKGMCISACLQ